VAAFATTRCGAGQPSSNSVVRKVLSAAIIRRWYSGWARAQTSSSGHSRGQPWTGQPTAHAGLGDRNIETEQVEQVHVFF
jgi:hypothetical protein